MAVSTLIPLRQTMDLFEIVKKRTVPGMLILDDRKKPVYLNAIAVDILHSLSLNGSRPSSSRKTDDISIPQEIFNLYDDLKKSFHLPLQDQGDRLTSLIVLIPAQKESYCCRGFFL